MSTATLERSEKAIEISAFRFDPTLHNGRITILNTNTGNHRTFRIETITTPGAFLGKRIISLLYGISPEDDRSWRGFAFADEFGIHVWKRYKQNNDGSTSVYVKYANMLSSPSKFEGKGCQYMIEGRCRRCNRVLTHPESITDGMGPVCREKA